MTVPNAQRPAPPTQLRIGLWGPPGSGKTTFLAALKIATMRRPEGALDWMMTGADDRAVDRLQDWVYQLTTRRSFPTATEQGQSILFRFVGQEQVERRTRLGRVFHETRPVQFELDVLDVPGGYFDHSTTEAEEQPLRIAGEEAAVTGGGVSLSDHEQRLLDHLQQCHGIIYLFDPERDAKEGDAFRYFHPVLEKLAARITQQSNYLGGKLPQHVAVCVTKFDQPDIYRKAWTRGYTVPDAERPFLPRVTNEMAVDFFRELCDDPLTNTDLLDSGLRLHFQVLNYFVTSSIGFYVENGRFRPHDCMNFERVSPGPNGLKIKGKVFPINVLEPLLWLHDSLTRSRSA